MFKRLFLLALSLLAGCGLFDGGESSYTSSQSSTTTQEEVREAPLSLFTPDGKPLQSATVYFYADANGNGLFEEEEKELYTSGSGGEVFLEDSPGLHRLLRVEAPGFVPLVKNLSPGVPLPQAVTLKRVEGEEAVELRSTSSGLVVKTPYLELSLPSYRELSGVSRVEVGMINPGAEPATMPADFKGYWQGPSILSSTGAFFVRFYDESSQPIELPPGNYTVKVKVFPENYSGISDFDPSTPEVEIPLWYLNPETGLWEREDELGYLVDLTGRKVKREELPQLLTSQESELFVEGQVKHFSFINCDIPTRPAGISGRLVGLENCQEAYLEVVGVNWNGGQGGNRANPDCTFSLPLPYSPEPDEGDFSDCPEITREAVLQVLDKMSLYPYDLNLSEECRAQWKEALKAYESAVLAFRDYLYDLARLPGLTEADRDAIILAADKFTEAAFAGEPKKAEEFFESVVKIYANGEKISAEDFVKIEEKLAKKLLDNALNAFYSSLGLPIESNISGGQPVKVNFATFFKDLLGGATAPNSCLRPILEGYTDTAVKELNDMLYAIAAGKPVVYDDPKKTHFLLNFTSNTINKMVSGGKLNPDFVNCLKSIPELSKYGKALEEGAQTAVREFGRFAAYAQFAAAGIQSYFDILDAKTELNKKALALRWQESMDKALRLLRSSVLMVDPECIPTDEFPELFDFADYDPEECNLSHALAAALFTDDEERADDGTPTSWELLVDAVEGLKGLVEQWEIVEAVSGRGAGYGRWVDAKSGEEVELTPEVPGRPNGYGRYLSKLLITVPSKGIYRLPVTVLSSEGVDLQLIPSPAVPAYWGDKLITAWVGEVPVGELLSSKTSQITFNFELPEGAELVKLKSLYFDAGDGHLVPLRAGCTVNGSSVQCTYPLYAAYEEAPVRLVARFLLLYGGRTYELSYGFDGVNLSSQSELPVKVYLCKRPVVGQISAPEAVSPLEEFKVSAEVSYSEYLSTEACATQEPVYRWYLGYYEAGRGVEATLRAPDKKTLYFFGGKILLSFKLSQGDFSLTAAKWLKVEVFNQPPVIERLELPQSVPPGESTFTVRATVKEPDGDPLTYRWFAYPVGLVEVVEGVNSEEAKVSVIHTSKDYRGELCLQLSDGIEKTLKCQEFTVEKEALPPKILQVSYSAQNLHAPAQVNFTVSYLSTLPLEEVQVEVVSDNGTETLSFTSPDFSITFDEEGFYTLNFTVKDAGGQSSQPYTATLTVLPPLEVSLTPQAYISSYEAETGQAQLGVELFGASELHLLQVMWDLNGDGIYELSTEEPYLELYYTKELAQEAGSIGVKLVALEGEFTLELPLSSIPPLVQVNASPTEGEAPLTVNFTVSTFSLTGEPEKFYFDVDGDGEFEVETTEPELSYTFTSPGIYSVIVKVLFSDGREAYEGAPVRVTSAGEALLFTFKESAGSLSKVYGFFSGGSEALFAAGYYDGTTTRLLVGTFGLEGALSLDGTASLNATPSYSALLPLTDGYLLAVYGNFCKSEECTSRAYATCVLKVSDENSWYTCISPLSLADRALYYGGRLYLYGSSAFAVLSAQDGSVLAVKKVNLDGYAVTIRVLWVDEGGIYLFGTSSGGGILLKLNPEDYSVLYAKRFIYPEAYSTLPYVYALAADEDYLYGLFLRSVWLSTSASDLLKFKKEDGSLVLAEQLLYKCPRYCMTPREIKVEDDYLYALFAYPYWQGDGQVVLKLSKGGDFVYARRVELCQSSDCSDEALGLALSGDSLFVFGRYSPSEGANGIYGVSLLKEGGSGCEGIVSSLTSEEVEFNAEEVEVSVNSLETSRFSVLDADWQRVELYFNLEVLPSPFELTSSCP